MITILNDDKQDTEQIREILHRNGYVTGLSLTQEKDLDLPASLLLQLERYEKSVKELEEKANAANTELDTFAYAVSHDLQEPLRMVSSYIQLLQKRYQGKLDKESDEFINYAVCGVRRMKTMLDDLLNYTRISRHRLGIRQFDSDALFRDAVKRINKRYPNTKLEIIGDLPSIKADPDLIMNLMNEILNNAVKFNKNETPWIRISAETDKDSWIFRIKDNGIGIDGNFKDKIFNIFYKLHNHTDYPGSGVGLAVCKKIIELHKGKLYFESQPDDGSTFIFEIPHASN